MNDTQKQKSPALVILVTLLTCGIYGLYWIATTHNLLRELDDNQEGTSGGMVVLFLIITCGIYGFYWWYKVGQKMAEIGKKTGVGLSDNAVLYLVLCIFRLTIVSMAILQGDLNKVLNNGQFDDGDF